MMRLSLRIKLFAIVLVSAVALIALTIFSGASEKNVETEIESIRDTYLPKIQVRSALGASFTKLSQDMQSAVEAADADLLASATDDYSGLLAIINTSRGMTLGQAAVLRLAVSDYVDTAVPLSKRLIAGEGGESTPQQVQEMQAKQRRVAALIDQTTRFDEQALAKAFAITAAEQRAAMRTRLAVTVVCLVILLALSLWIGRGLFTSLRHLVDGLQRFGRNDFATPIAVTSRDELAEVARQANRMADELHQLDRDRTTNEWIRAGLVGLGDELRGDFDLHEVANRTLAYLASYLAASAGALYYGDASGPLHLRGRYAISKGTVPEEIALGEGLVGEAASGRAITVIESAGGLTLRSGLVDVKPTCLVLVPVSRNRQRAVIELALARAWRDRDRKLLELATETVGITLEVAERRAAARALLQKTQQQAQELERAGAALEERATELARASEYKTQFLTGMSHELRTPLNAIIGFSEIMYDQSVPLDAETTHEYLGDILTSGRHLLQLINDVLDLAKVEAGKLEFHPEPLELTKVVTEVLAVLKTTAAKQHVDVATDIDPAVSSIVLDASRLKQVLYNYLSNALKFTPPRGKVTVRARAEADDRVRIEVEDSGVGIAPEDIARLFADFQQTHAGARKTDSSGLGLALTKRIVEAQGGTVGVRSVVGKGSTFHAILPRRSGDVAPATNSVQVVHASASAPTVLVVEDDPNDRERLVAALFEAGYSVEAVGSGAQALERCAARTYDAITLDLLLPDMSGLDVLRAVRDSINGNVPVIVVTVVAEHGAVAGFTVHDLLAKPLSEPALLASLHRAGVDAKKGDAVVLVVDDDPASLKVMAASLGRLGYLAVCEQDPVRGLRLAMEEPPSAVILDLLMPNMTGFEFLETFRTSSAGRHVPVIVWTSKDLTADELARLRTSANAVVSKGHDGNARVLAELEVSLPLRKRVARSA
jgi:signal transduction histidine kinase/DNA-binding response OmpR family regulator